MDNIAFVLLLRLWRNASEVWACVSSYRIAHIDFVSITRGKMLALPSDMNVGVYCISGVEVPAVGTGLLHRWRVSDGGREVFLRIRSS